MGSWLDTAIWWLSRLRVSGHFLTFPCRTLHIEVSSPTDSIHHRGATELRLEAQLESEHTAGGPTDSVRHEWDAPDPFSDFSRCYGWSNSITMLQLQAIKAVISGWFTLSRKNIMLCNTESILVSFNSITVWVVYITSKNCTYTVGIPWIWIGVGWTMPFFFKPFRIAADKREQICYK